jgi:hypothetical protein
MDQELLEVATEAVESSFEDVDPEGLPALLRGLGWDLVGVLGGGRREEWFCGDLVGIVELLEVPRRFWASVKSAGPEDGEDDRALHREFADAYQREADAFAAVFGEPTVVLRGETVPSPIQADFVFASVWLGEAYGVVIGYQHEDKGVPYWVGVHVFERPPE